MNENFFVDCWLAQSSGIQIYESPTLIIRRRRLVKRTLRERFFSWNTRPFWKKKRWGYWPCQKLKIEKYDAPYPYLMKINDREYVGHPEKIKQIRESLPALRRQNNEHEENNGRL